ncbi:MAG: PQQ-binding-like beta-propeller repeat protein [Actinomycetota bacterium]
MTPRSVRRAALVAAVCVLGASGLSASPAASQTASSCAPARHAGGDWPTYGHDLSNTRSQPAEKSIGPQNVASLAPAWAFTPSTAVPAGADGGGFSNTPTVSDGCIFLTSNTGWVFALNADTGAPVWRTVLRGAGQALVGGVIVGSPTAHKGVVYVGVSRPGSPYVAALDQKTGKILWRTTVEGQPNSFINAGPVLFGGLVFQGFAGYEGNTEASRGGYAILDATGGRILAHHHTISDKEFAAGHRGGSVWCTSVVDPRTKYLYACGGNPHSEGLEARYANSILKIDLDRHRRTFGRIVASYKGNVDQYYQGLDDQPVCDNFADETTLLVWSVGCVMLDLDFGASPNLFRDGLGRLIVGDLQKSGVYHAVFADSMRQAWSAVVGLPCFSCNAASGAFDGDRLLTVGTPPGQLVALGTEEATLRHQWVTPILDVIHYQSVSAANGVAYVLDNVGNLHAFEGATGLPLWKRPLLLDNGGTPASDPGSSQGVAVARNTVYAASAQWVVAFRLDGEPAEPGAPGPGIPLPGAGLTVVAGPGAVAATYLTPVTTVQADDPALSFLNLDVAPHDVDHKPPAGQPRLFESPVIGTGQSTDVLFKGKLQAGQQYDFYCSIHPNMFGTLLAQ